MKSGKVKKTELKGSHCETQAGEGSSLLAAPEPSAKKR
jgi:hypothetical protein